MMENQKEIYLAGGCFWGTEKYFSLIPGVLQTVAGYANGNTENPTYEEVCRNNTGHAENVRIVYDESIISLDFLLAMYYKAIDPTTLNRQGGDRGVQYRTGIYYTDPADETIIRESLKTLQMNLDQPVRIEIRPLEHFYPAEEYHQKYLDKNPTGYCHIPSVLFREAAQAADPSKS